MNLCEVLRFLPGSFSKHWPRVSVLPPLNVEGRKGGPGWLTRALTSPPLASPSAFSPALPCPGAHCPLIFVGMGHLSTQIFPQ